MTKRTGEIHSAFKVVINPRKLLAHLVSICFFFLLYIYHGDYIPSKEDSE